MLLAWLDVEASSPGRGAAVVRHARVLPVHGWFRVCGPPRGDDTRALAGAQSSRRRQSRTAVCVFRAAPATNLRTSYHRGVAPPSSSRVASARDQFTEAGAGADYPPHQGRGPTRDPAARRTGRSSWGVARPSIGAVPARRGRHPTGSWLVVGPVPLVAHPPHTRSELRLRRGDLATRTRPITGLDDGKRVLRRRAAGGARTHLRFRAPRPRLGRRARWRGQRRFPVSGPPPGVAILADLRGCVSSATQTGFLACHWGSSPPPRALAAPCPARSQGAGQSGPVV